MANAPEGNGTSLSGAALAAAAPGGVDVLRRQRAAANGDLNRLERARLRLQRAAAERATAAEAAEAAAEASE